MCAIAGLISAKLETLDVISGMNRLMRHRGPDDEGYLSIGPGGPVSLGGRDTASAVWATDSPWRPAGMVGPAAEGGAIRIALAHRRLSIVDLSPLGHQPMSHAGRYWIVYNGEVYNYRELRAELEAAGSTFLSHSDTEVILAAYSRWGAACLDRFNGMWALAIYDAEKQELFLARDRFGVKPLYYRMAQATFAFASEIKAFTAVPDWEARANEQAVQDFLLHGLQDHSSETMFAGVQQLEPGTYAILDCRRWLGAADAERSAAFKVRRWYALPPACFDGDFDAAAARFLELFRDAVALRLRSDAPIASCLSGGLDSSAIVCTVREQLIGQGEVIPQKTFTACSELPRFDEREYSEKVVAMVGAQASHVFPSAAGLFAALDELIWHQDEPFGSTSIYAQWTVFAAAAAKGVKVMLDGQGADELFYGYQSFRRPFLANLVRTGKWRAAFREAGGGKGRLRALRDAWTPLPVQSAFRAHRRRSRLPGWLHPRRLNAENPGRLASRFERFQNARELSLEMMTGQHLQKLLHWEDRNSMAHAIEARLPFLDYRLAEFALSLPDQHKIRDDWSKAVVRSGMRDLMPEPVRLRRDKMAFVTPEEIWARETHADTFRAELAEAVAVSRGILTSGAPDYLERIIRGELPYDTACWRMICFGRWVKRFGVKV